MTQGEKNLLTKDLCARLPYRVRLGFENSNVILRLKDYNIFTEQLFADQIFPEQNNEFGFEIYVYRPYLRPLSSMTEEEEKEYEKCFQSDDTTAATLLIDFYNKHHLDYRGLIEKGLALEAPENMYKNE
jgi:hypothetical protein